MGMPPATRCSDHRRPHARHAARGRCGRAGGDEFIVLVTGIDAPAALRLGEHLLQDVSHPIALADGDARA